MSALVVILAHSPACFKDGGLDYNIVAGSPPDMLVTGQLQAKISLRHKNRELKPPRHNLHTHPGLRLPFLSQ